MATVLQRYQAASAEKPVVLCDFTPPVLFLARVSLERARSQKRKRGGGFGAAAPLDNIFYLETVSDWNYKNPLFKDQTGLDRTFPRNLKMTTKTAETPQNKNNKSINIKSN